MNTKTHEPCPRCGEGHLREWDELSAEEQEIVRRLPASADYSFGEREATHRWCANCWYEATEGAPCEA